MNFYEYTWKLCLMPSDELYRSAMTSGGYTWKLGLEINYGKLLYRISTVPY